MTIIGYLQSQLPDCKLEQKGIYEVCLTHHVLAQTCLQAKYGNYCFACQDWHTQKPCRKVQ